MTLVHTFSTEEPFVAGCDVSTHNGDLLSLLFKSGLMQLLCTCGSEYDF